MKLKYSINLLLFLIFLSLGYSAIGQTENAQAPSAQIENNNTSPQEENTKKAVVPTTNILHQNGRINLVVFVLATIFVGIILYLVRIERTLNKIEKK